MSPNLPILFSFRRCPYAMRARLALASSRQEVTHREVDLKERPKELYAASPKGTVPVLILPDDTVLQESLDIMHWALQQNDPEDWSPTTLEKTTLTKSLIQQNDGDFKFHLDRYKYANRYENTDADHHREAASKILATWQTRLEKSAFLTGPRFALADGALAPFVRQFALADPRWFDAQAWPHLQSWLKNLLSSARFQGIMQKHKVWTPAH